jgi:hypothetical protein
MASKKNFTYILARTLRPKEAAWSRSGILGLNQKILNKKKISFPTLLLCLMAIFPLEMP